MSTTVAVFVPYLQPGKHVRVRNISVADGTPFAGDQWHTEPNVIKTFSIHDGAALEVAEVDAPAPPTMYEPSGDMQADQAPES